MLLSKQNDSPKMLGKTTSQDVTKVLSPLFFCENIMLLMIKKIGEKDLSCMLNSAELDIIKIQEEYNTRQQSPNRKPVLVDFLKAPPPPTSETQAKREADEKQAGKKQKNSDRIRIPKKIGEGRHNPTLKVLTQGSWRKK